MQQSNTASFQHYRHEAKKLIQLSAPILIGQLAVTGMGATDTIMAGNYHATDLAAIAIGQSFWLPTVLFFVGFFTASTTLVAHAFGANNPTQLRDTFTQAGLCALLLAPIGCILLINAQPVINLLKLDEQLSLLTGQYLKALAFGLPGAISFMVMRSLIEGMGKTRPIMLIQLFIFGLNIPLNYAFIFGRWGAPELGGFGCGVATAIALWLQCLCGLILLYSHPVLKSLKLTANRIQLQADIFKRLFVLGTPTAFTFLAEVMLFSVIALIIAPLGTDIIAGHQIALSVSALTFMLPLSIGMAITIRAGQQLGAGDQAQANFSCKTGLYIILLCSSLMTGLILLLKHHVASLYSNDPAVISIASALLVFSALYQIPDAVQVCMASALRAYQDTRVPLAIVLFAYWVVSVPFGWSITFGQFGLEPLGAAGMWIGLVCGLSAAALMLGWRFWRVKHRPAPAHPSHQT